MEGFVTEGYESQPNYYADVLNVKNFNELSDEVLVEKLCQYSEVNPNTLMPRAREERAKILRHIVAELDWRIDNEVSVENE